MFVRFHHHGFVRNTAHNPVGFMGIVLDTHTRDSARELVGYQRLDQYSTDAPPAGSLQKQTYIQSRTADFDVVPPPFPEYLRPFFSHSILLLNTRANTLSKRRFEVEQQRQ